MRAASDGEVEAMFDGLKVQWSRSITDLLTHYFLKMVLWRPSKSVVVYYYYNDWPHSLFLRNRVRPGPVTGHPYPSKLIYNNPVLYYYAKEPPRIIRNENSLASLDRLGCLLRSKMQGPGGQQTLTVDSFAGQTKETSSIGIPDYQGRLTQVSRMSEQPYTDT
jgi:hypothetical protein